MAKLHNIQLRTGCFCNPGACQRHLNLTDAQLKQHFKVVLIIFLDEFDLKVSGFSSRTQVSG